MIGYYNFCLETNFNVSSDINIIYNLEIFLYVKNNNPKTFIKNN